MAKFKKATVEIGGKNYTFELDRTTVIYLEEEVGFAVSKVEAQPVTQSRNIWVGGLQKHHPKLKFATRVDLYHTFQEEGGDVSEIVAFLIEQYASFLQTIPNDTQKKKEIIFE